MASHVIILGPRARYGNKGPIYHVKVNGISLTPRLNPITDGARWLIANGAHPSSNLKAAWHDGRPSMAGSVRGFARVVGAENATSSIRLAKWAPHPALIPSLPPRLRDFAEEEGLLNLKPNGDDDEEE
jgi:hypothetical protein